MRFFKIQNQDKWNDYRIFAFSDDGRAVSCTPGETLWRPFIPSRKVAEFALSHPDVHELGSDEVEDLLSFCEPPRNFKAQWRAEQRWSGWVAVCAYFAPAIPLWFIWDDLVQAAGFEIAAGLAVLLQLTFVFLAHEFLLYRVPGFVSKAEKHWELFIQQRSSETRSVEPPQKSRNTVYRNELLDRAKIAGFDSKKLEKAFKDMSDKKLRQLAKKGTALAGFDRETKLSAILSNSDVYEAVEGFYVGYKNRVFHFAELDESWIQSFDKLTIKINPLSSTSKIRGAIFDNPNYNSAQVAGQFINLAFDAVEPNQRVRLGVQLPDGRETSVKLNAIKWSVALIGLPLIVEHKTAGCTYKWHFNDVPPQLTIYEVTNDPVDPLKILVEKNWRDLPYKVE